MQEAMNPEPETNSKDFEQQRTHGSRLDGPAQEQRRLTHKQISHTHNATDVDDDAKQGG